MDTGISTDSYAIIELGMVDDIIKDKENSRRRMLEQAAGITIYQILVGNHPIINPNHVSNLEYKEDILKF